MKGKRLFQTLRLCTIRSPKKRAEYLKNVFYSVGDNCTIMDRKVPLYPELISIGNNVHIASHVYLTTHDITHRMVNNYFKANDVNHKVSETIGCIRIGDNVFIGSGTRILGNVDIGSNVIIGASSLVNKDIPNNSVAAGVPARVISSFDDYINKRLANNTVTAFGGGENLQEKDAKFYWDLFYRNRESQNIKDEKHN